MRNFVAVVALLLTTSPLLAADPPHECPVSPALPSYPLIARAAHVEGTVKLNVSVDAGGRPSATVISGHPMLVQASVDVLERWWFGAGARSFLVSFVYRIDEKANPTGSSCSTSRVVIDLPTVEVWGMRVPLNTSNSPRK